MKPKIAMPNSQVVFPETSQGRRQTQPVASPRHTVGVVLLLGTLVAASSWLGQFGHAKHRLLGYIAMSAAEWLITGFIWFGCGLRSCAFRTLLGDFAVTPRAVLRDLSLALAFLILSNIGLAEIGRLMRAAPTQSLQSLLPHGPAEIAGYLLLSLTAGICEEAIYRGYLQQQFIAWTKSVPMGVLTQSILFGVSHAYQGPGMVLTISVYGLFFGPSRSGAAACGPA